MEYIAFEGWVWRLSSYVAWGFFCDRPTCEGVYWRLIPTIFRTSSCVHSYLFVTVAERWNSNWMKDKFHYQNRRKKMLACEYIVHIKMRYKYLKHAISPAIRFTDSGKWIGSTVMAVGWPIHSTRMTVNE